MSTNIPTVIDDMPVYDRFGFAFDIDQWYPSCASFTIPTQFIAVSPAYARILCKLYEFNVKKEQDKALTPEEYNTFKQLEESIDTVLRSNPYFYNEEDDTAAAFVRMSGYVVECVNYTSDVNYCNNIFIAVVHQRMLCLILKTRSSK